MDLAFRRGGPPCRPWFDPGLLGWVPPCHGAEDPGLPGGVLAIAVREDAGRDQLVELRAERLVRREPEQLVEQPYAHGAAEHHREAQRPARLGGQTLDAGGDDLARRERDVLAGRAGVAYCLDELLDEQ